MTTSRLDAAMASRGLARSRSHALQLITEGRVRVNGAAVVRASRPVTETDSIDVEGETRYVSRAAHKLIGALDAFGVNPAGRWCLDVGASTGGFTQVLLEREADGVVALDVGHGQLAAVVRENPRVVNVEGFNARDLTAESFDAISPSRPSLVVADVSFISLTLLMTQLAQVATADADLVLLIKPQFEVGKGNLKTGLVTDPALRLDAIETVLWSAYDAGLGVHGLVASAVTGEHGNQEYVVHLRPLDVSTVAGSREPGSNALMSDEDPHSPAQWRDRIREVGL